MRARTSSQFARPSSPCRICKPLHAFGNLLEKDEQTSTHNKCSEDDDDPLPQHGSALQPPNRSDTRLKEPTSCSSPPTTCDDVPDGRGPIIRIMRSRANGSPKAEPRDYMRHNGNGALP